ncbi:hypothetical protein C8F01DRAFT_1248671 [Mycena amicta]|nr:hypothetical protein C8F01DRAFT_1248671 [Mycena amicta]
MSKKPSTKHSYSGQKVAVCDTTDASTAIAAWAIKKLGGKIIPLMKQADVFISSLPLERRHRAHRMVKKLQHKQQPEGKPALQTPNKIWQQMGPPIVAIVAALSCNPHLFVFGTGQRMRLHFAADLGLDEHEKALLTALANTCSAEVVKAGDNIQLLICGKRTGTVYIEALSHKAIVSSLHWLLGAIDDGAFRHPMNSALDYPHSPSLRSGWRMYGLLGKFKIYVHGGTWEEKVRVALLLTEIGLGQETNFNNNNNTIIVVVSFGAFLDKNGRPRANGRPVVREAWLHACVAKGSYIYPSSLPYPPWAQFSILDPLLQEDATYSAMAAAWARIGGEKK